MSSPYPPQYQPPTTPGHRPKSSGNRRVLIMFGSVAVAAVAVAAVTGTGKVNGNSATSTRVPTSTISLAEAGASAAARVSSSSAAESASSAAAASSSAASSAAASAIAAKEAAEKDPANYTAISARDFAILAKNPDEYLGRKLVIYGRITQSDAATGTKNMRANTAGQPGDYKVNSFVTGKPDVLAPVVEGDLVTMLVRVNGSKSYETTLGGTLTVPEFEAYVITVTGSS